MEVRASSLRSVRPGAWEVEDIDSAACWSKNMTAEPVESPDVGLDRRQQKRPQNDKAVARRGKRESSSSTFEECVER